MGSADKTEIRISKLVLRLPTLRVGPQFRDKFKIRISKCSKQILEDKYRDLWVLVILILSIRICFVLRASDFEFGFECAPCPLLHALRTTDHGLLTTDNQEVSQGGIRSINSFLFS